jgi:Mce-associated membrane protein
VTKPTDLAARLRAVDNSAFRYGDDDLTTTESSTESTEDTVEEPTDVPADLAEDVDPEPATPAEDVEAPADDVEPEPEASEDAADERATGLRAGWRALVEWRLLPAALLVITVLLAGLGAVMLIRAHIDQVDGPMANQALVSTGDTQEAVSQVSTALNQILSYDMANPKPAQAAARHWLVGDAPAQYQTLVGALGKVAAGQQLTMVAKVSTAAVLSLHDGTAQLLVFLDRQSTRASDHSSSVSAAQVQITAVRTSGGWRISEIVPL